MKKEMIAVILTFVVSFYLASCSNPTLTLPIDSDSASISEVSSSVESVEKESSLSAVSGGEVITVEVSTVKEFYEAIAPNRIIKLHSGPYQLDELSDIPDTNPYVSIRSETNEVIIQNVFNLSIIGLGDERVEIFTKYEQADVLTFKNTEGVRISNVRMGHFPVKGGCYGGVLFFKNSEDITITGSSFFGCGINGLEVNNVNTLLFQDSVIEDCDYIMCIGNSQNITFLDSSFQKTNGSSLFNISGCKSVLFNRCAITDNVGKTDIGVLFQIDYGFPTYAEPIDTSDVISEILIKDSVIKGNWTTSLTMTRAPDKSANSLTFENVEFANNNFES